MIIIRIILWIMDYGEKKQEDPSRAGWSPSRIQHLQAPSQIHHTPRHAGSLTKQPWPAQVGCDFFRCAPFHNLETSNARSCEPRAPQDPVVGGFLDMAPPPEKMTSELSMRRSCSTHEFCKKEMGQDTATPQCALFDCRSQDCRPSKSHTLHPFPLFPFYKNQNASFPNLPASHVIRLHPTYAQLDEPANSPQS